LLVCLIFLILGRTSTQEWLTALTIAAVVCIASSNGGTTSQDLKTGYLVGATPSKQQWAILIVAVSSALGIGYTMLHLIDVGTRYPTQACHNVVLTVPDDAPREKPGKPHNRDQEAKGDNPGWKADTKEYRVVHVRQGDYDGRGGEYDKLKPGRYLVDDN